VIRIIPTLEFLIKRWETMALQPQYLEIRDALAEGVKSLQKWYHRADTTSSAYFICMSTLWQLFHQCVANLHTVLDPSIKDQYFRAKWEADRFGKAKEQLENVVSGVDMWISIKAYKSQFDKYYAEMPGDSQALSPPASRSVAPDNALHRYGSSFLLDAVKEAQQSRAELRPRDELERYLSAPLEATPNVLHWWGVGINSFSL
jgi:hypothetical protein